MLSEALGAPLSVTLDGVEYQFSQLTQDVRATFERYITDLCLRSIMASKGFIPEQSFNFLLSQHYEKIAQGAYDLFGTIGRTFLAEDTHAVHWLWVLASRYRPNLTKAQMQELYNAHPIELFQLLVQVMSKKNCPSNSSPPPTAPSSASTDSSPPTSAT